MTIVKNFISNKWMYLRTLLGVSCCLLFSVSAWASSGIVILAKGAVTATDAAQQSRLLSKGAEVHEGDVINTSAKSFAVIKMADNSKLTLKPDTTIAIGKFDMDEGEEEASINLVKGGLRTVTGLIGQRKPESFKVDTPIASIGIRGTDFVTMIHEKDQPCDASADFVPPDELGGDLSGESKATTCPEGLYTFTHKGKIVMRQCDGQAQTFSLRSFRDLDQASGCVEVELGAGTAGYSSAPVYTAGARTSSTTNPVPDAESLSVDSGGDTGSGSEPAGSSAGGARVAPLESVPAMLDKDPVFALSDLPDSELDRIDGFPGNFSSGGQCTISGG